jgi:hypothetical protein
MGQEYDYTYKRTEHNFHYWEVYKLPSDQFKPHTENIPGDSSHPLFRIEWFAFVRVQEGEGTGGIDLFMQNWKLRTEVDDQYYQAWEEKHPGEELTRDIILSHLFWRIQQLHTKPPNIGRHEKANREPGQNQALGSRIQGGDPRIQSRDPLDYLSECLWTEKGEK